MSMCGPQVTRQDTQNEAWGRQLSASLAFRRPEVLEGGGLARGRGVSLFAFGGAY